VFAGTSHYAAHVFVCCRDFLPAKVAATSSCRDLLPDELCLFPGEECLVNYFSGEAAPYSRSSKNVSKHSGHAVHARKTPNCYSLVRAVWASEQSPASFCLLL